MILSGHKAFRNVTQPRDEIQKFGFYPIDSLRAGRAPIIRQREISSQDEYRTELFKDSAAQMCSEATCRKSTRMIQAKSVN